MKILLAIDDSKFLEAATQAVIAQYRPQGTQVTRIGNQNKYFANRSAPFFQGTRCEIPVFPRYSSR